MALAGSLSLATPAHGQDTGAEAESLDIDEILVEAPTRGARPLQEAAAAVSVVDSDEIERRQAETFEDLLGDAAGVSIEGGPRGIAQEPNIRGFQDEQIVIRVDGARQNFNVAHRGRFFIDPDVIQRVEVVRGGASALYGSGALGGVVSVETKDVEDMLDPGESWGGRLRGSYSTNGGAYFGSGTIFGEVGDFDALAFLGWREMSDDLEGGSGDEISASELDIKNGLLKLGFESTEALRFEANLQHYQDDGLVPVNSNAAAAADNRIVDRDVTVGSYRLGVDYAPEGSNAVNLKALVYYNTNEVEEDRQDDGRLDTTDYETLGVDIANSSRFRLGAPVILTYGFEGYRDTQSGTRNGADREQLPDAEATYLAGFAQAEIEITERLTLTPGLRYDHFDLNPDDDSGLEDRSEGELSPRIALSFAATENVTFWGSWSRSFRAPSLTELYVDGTHFDTGAFPLDPLDPTAPFHTGLNEFVPNPDLEPERASQFEIGLRTRFRDVARDGDRLTVAANAYYADVENYIDQTVSFIDFSTYNFMTNTVGGTTTTRNVDAELWGFEAELAYDAAAWFGGASLTIPRGEAKDETELGSIPQDKLTLSLGFRPFTAEPAIEFGGRGNFRRGQEGGEETAGSSVFDVFAAYAPKDGPLEGARFQIGVDNLLDREYRIHPTVIEQPGRTLKISGSVQF